MNEPADISAEPSTGPAPRSGGAVRFAAAALGVSLVVAMALGCAASAWGWFHFGAVTIEVDNRMDRGGLHWRVPVPGALFVAGLGAARATGGLRIHTGLAERRLVGDLLRTMADEIEAAPDGVYLEVESDDPGESVRVIKEGDDLRLQVRDGGDSVSIRLPARLAARSLRLVRVS